MWQKRARRLVKQERAPRAAMIAHLGHRGIAPLSVALLLVLTLSVSVYPSGTIIGTVRDSFGVPVGAGAAIRVFAGSQGHGIFYTDSSGQYATPSLPAGEYTLALNIEPLATLEDVWCEGVVVQNGQMTELDFDLSVGGKIAGTVLDENGLPVGGAHVRVFRWRPYSTPSFMGGFAETNEHGQYELHGLDEGTYTVALNLTPDSHNEDLWYEGFDVQAGLVAEAPFDFRDGGAVTGVITDEDGMPVAGAHLRVFRWHPFSYPSYSSGFGVADSSGVYRVVGLDPGTYTVALGLIPDSPNEHLWYEGFQVREGEEAEAPFDLREGGGLAGIVVGAECATVEDAHVCVFRQQPVSYPSYSRGFAFTDSQGDYVVIGLDPGTYAAAVNMNWPSGPEVLRMSIAIIEGQVADGRVDLCTIGDINGDLEVDLVDVLLLYRHVNGIVWLDDVQRARADIDQDGDVDEDDAQQLANIVFGV